VRPVAAIKPGGGRNSLRNPPPPPQKIDPSISSRRSTTILLLVKMPVLLDVQEDAVNMSWSTELHLLDLLWIWRYETLTLAIVFALLEICVVLFVLWRERRPPRQPAKPKNSSRGVSSDEAPTATDAHKANQAVHREGRLALHSTDSS